MRRLCPPTSPPRLPPLRFGKSSTEVHVPRFRAPDTAMNYDQLTVAISDGLVVVGIDLTGSEERPSGWCELRGREAQTRPIDTDDAMVAEIVRLKPHIVSIDSPLSLPKGRQRVDDDDPTRERHGIMRQCERTLKQRGIKRLPQPNPEHAAADGQGNSAGGEVAVLGNSSDRKLSWRRPRHHEHPKERGWRWSLAQGAETVRNRR